jgi:hypothetical protein
MESFLLILFFSGIIIYKNIFKSDVIYIELPEKNEPYKNASNKTKKKKYLVRNVKDKEQAVKILNHIHYQLELLTNKLLNDNNVLNDSMYKYILNLKDKLDDVEIQESSADSIYTSYSVNKGEMLVFCIRSKKDNKIHDINDLLYVAIHELAHIACPEIGHTELFFSINSYLIKKAIEYGIYKYVDYNSEPHEYCGIDLSVSVANN